MPKKSYIGDSENYAKLIPNIGYVGDEENKSKRLLKGYIGNAQNKAKLFWEYAAGIVKNIFRDRFNYTSHFVYSRTYNFSYAHAENTKYSGTSTEDAIKQWMFTSFNTIDDTTGTYGLNNPLLMTYGTGPFASLFVVKTQRLQGSGEAKLYIPTLMFGLTKLKFTVSGEGNTGLAVGVGVRVQDDEREVPSKVVANYAIVGSQENVEISLDLDNIRADYIYIMMSNQLISGNTEITLNQITATYKRTYGIVDFYSPGPPPSFARYYLNYPKFGFLSATFYEYSIIAATSAVWLLVYCASNTYIGDNVYADIEKGQYWGDGDTIFLLISKESFTIEGPGSNIYNSNSTSISGKTIHYYMNTIGYDLRRMSSPMHSYAYTYYDGWTGQGVQAIAAIGYNILYRGLPIQ